ncbi:MAG: hypothetical protein PHI97_08940 [Desulfobulbus sp.]|nr:hypothetical protein [Desulfobulbus sp.]
MKEEHMHWDNKLTLNGGDLSTLNLYIMKTDQVIRVCNMMRDLYSAIDDSKPRSEEIVAFKNSATTRYGTGALFEMIANYLGESFTEVDEILDENTSFADPAAQEFYHGSQKTKQNGEGEK